MTLYLKYRPQSLDDLDSKEVRESLKKIMSSRQIPHAFLFAGPKGIGKTSAARIISKILNCEGKNPPCGKCEQCTSITRGNNIDVIELDAASHRGIDDIRALREVVKLSPARAKKKVYIIDEAHMLTVEASNALLKTLEEPPGHVVFILATTNPEKLLGTIRSRSTEVTFKKATREEMIRSLSRVIKGEKIKIDDNTLTLIAERSNGSFRDGVKALEQYALEGSNFLLKSSTLEIDKFMQLLFAKDQKELLGEIKNRTDSGVSAEDLTRDILADLQQRLIGGEGNKQEIIKLIELILVSSKQIPDSPIEELPLEIAVIKWCADKNDAVPQGDDREKEKTEENHGKNSSFQASSANLSEEIWKSILGMIRPINASIEALLRASKPLEFRGNTLTLGVYYKFHKERLEEAGHRRVLEDVVARVMGSPIKISCILTDPPARDVKEEPLLTESKDQDIIKAAEEIFGV